MGTFVAYFLGLLTGIILLILVLYLRKNDSRKIAKSLFDESQDNIRNLMNVVSTEALRQNTLSFMQLADATLSRQSMEGQHYLEVKKQLIDQTLDQIKSELKKMEDMVTGFEKDREQKFGQISQQLRFTAEQTELLRQTAGQLHSALASTKSRGQWGERMAEDVLRLAGFIEGINYSKQKTLDYIMNRPDFTFYLPHQLKIHMDVKFPLDNYLHYLNSDNETEKERHRTQFLKDVKNRIKEVTGRDYINPAENTVDYVLVFIPNEQVYHFIHEKELTILDNALQNKVILCSPITLYAILAVIRQAVDNFNLEHTTSEILTLLNQFYKQWQLFYAGLDKMGKRIEDLQKEYQLLISTRRNQLEKPLLRIESFRQSKGLSNPAGEKEEEDGYNVSITEEREENE